MNEDLPVASLLAPQAALYTYRDSRSEPCDGAPEDMRTVVRAFFEAAPPWVHSLMTVRDALCAPLGLKTGGSGPVTEVEVGRSIGLFRVLALEETEAVLGEDDRHLDFRISLILQDRRLVVSTLVRPHNGLGRLYLTAVLPFHRLIAPVVTRNTARRLSLLP